MKNSAVLPKVLGSLGALTILLLLAAALTGNELLRIAGTLVLAIFGLLIVALVFAGLLSMRSKRDGT